VRGCEVVVWTGAPKGWGMDPQLEWANKYEDCRCLSAWLGQFRRMLQSRAQRLLCPGTVNCAAWTGACCSLCLGGTSVVAPLLASSFVRCAGGECAAVLAADWLSGVE
jgi:hypothetical protein